MGLGSRALLRLLTRRIHKCKPYPLKSESRKRAVQAKFREFVENECGGHLGTLVDDTFGHGSKAFYISCWKLINNVAMLLKETSTFRAKSSSSVPIPYFSARVMQDTNHII